MTAASARHATRVPSAAPAIPSSSSCSCGIGVGAPVIGSTPAWFFGNAMRVADVRLVEQRHRQAVDARTRCRRAAARPSRARRAGSRTSRAAPPAPMPEQVEDLLLQLGLVDPERAAGELDPVARRGRTRRARAAPGSVVEAARSLLVGRARERVVRRVQRSLSSSHSNSGKSIDPQELPERLVDRARARGRAAAAAAPSTLRDDRAARRRRRARVVPGLAPNALELGLARGTSRSASAPRRPRRRRGTRAPSRPTPSRASSSVAARRARTPAARAR